MTNNWVPERPQSFAVKHTWFQITTQTVPSNNLLQRIILKIKDNVYEEPNTVPGREENSQEAMIKIIMIMVMVSKLAWPLNLIAMTCWFKTNMLYDIKEICSYPIFLVFSRNGCLILSNAIVVTKIEF